ncbi:MAG: DUF484 family protein [Alphaproteobacteria bacterium]|nr:DUF484 family protein [Alphaproteobacteria bacterium]
MADRRPDPAAGTTAAPSQINPPPINAARVAAYLRTHPDFLVRHPDLVAVLTPPAPQRGEAIVDMQQFMLMRLQAEVRRVKDEQRALLAATRANMQSQSRIHDAALALLGARTFEHLVHTLTTDLALLLDVDVVMLCVETPDGRLPRTDAHGLAGLPVGAVAELFGPGREVLLRDDIVGEARLFGSGAGLVRSEAIVRLAVSGSAPACLLAIGSRDPERFHPGQGTELLGFLGKVGALSIRSWLDLPPT